MKTLSYDPFPLIVKATDYIPKRLTRFYIITEGT